MKTPRKRVTDGHFLILMWIAMGAKRRVKKQIVKQTINKPKH